MIAPDIKLTTDKVILRPIQESDLEPFLKLAASDQDMWEYFSYNLGDKDSTAQMDGHGLCRSRRRHPKSIYYH